VVGTSIQGTKSSNDDYDTGGRKITKISLLWVIVGLVATIILLSAIIYGVVRLIIFLRNGRRMLVNSADADATTSSSAPVAPFEEVRFDNYGNPVATTAFSPDHGSRFSSTVALPPSVGVAFTSIGHNQY